MSKSDLYRAELAALDDWDAYLLEHSGLPGPRANLELLDVVAEMGSEPQFKHWLGYDAERAPSNTRAEYLAVCGTVGLGTLIAQGKTKYLKTLRACASDPRWRVREGVAIALQHWGDADFGAVLDALEGWRDGNLYEQRAIAAALCEPRLLRPTLPVRNVTANVPYAPPVRNVRRNISSTPTVRNVHRNVPSTLTDAPSPNVKRVLKLLDDITRDFTKSKQRKSDDFVALKKGLSYCWSVAVAASPADGKRAMEKWFASADPDVRAVIRENLKKDRLKRMDAAWVNEWETKLK